MTVQISSTSLIVSLSEKLSEMFHLLTIVELREPKVSDFESVKVLVMAD